jgi:hypothetical protein
MKAVDEMLLEGNGATFTGVCTRTMIRPRAILIELDIVLIRIGGSVHCWHFVPSGLFAIHTRLAASRLNSMFESDYWISLI